MLAKRKKAKLQMSFGHSLCLNRYHDYNIDISNNSIEKDIAIVLFCFVYKPCWQ